MVWYGVLLIVVILARIILNWIISRLDDDNDLKTTWGDYNQAVFALLVAILSWFAIRGWFQANASLHWFWQDIFCFAIVGAILYGLDHGIKDANKLSGVAVGWILTALFLGSMVYDYTLNAKEDKTANNTTATVSVPPVPTTSLRLGVGTTKLKLLKGEVTPRLSFPEGKNVQYSISSSLGKKADYVITFSDGRKYSSTTRTLPSTEFGEFWVMANNVPQTIIVKVWE